MVGPSCESHWLLYVHLSLIQGASTSNTVFLFQLFIWIFVLVLSGIELISSQ